MKFLQLNRTRFLYAIILVCGLAWMWVSANPQNTSPGEISAPQAGFLAPDFRLNTLTGSEIHLSDLRGKAVLVNIWASWCPPCRAEMPAIERVYQSYKDQGLVVLAVNATSLDSMVNATSFVSENKLNFPILLDEKGSIIHLYQAESLPSSFFIGRDGIIQEVVIGGPMAEALLISRVEKLLGKVR
jgi:peroxiredoxin